MINKWYSIEKTTEGYTVYLNKEQVFKEHGGYGSSKIYTGSSKKECEDYCKQNNIKLKGEKNGRKFKIFI